MLTGNCSALRFGEWLVAKCFWGFRLRDISRSSFGSLVGLPTRQIEGGKLIGDGIKKMYWSYRPKIEVCGANYHGGIAT